MAGLRYHLRCTRNSLPGSSRRVTTKSCNIFSQATSSRDPARRVSQNSCSPSCRHNSHPNQQLGLHEFWDTRRSEEHTSELQSPDHLVCRLLLEKKKVTHSHLTNLPHSYVAP